MEIGKFAVGMGLKLGEELKGPKFTKFTKYAEQILERPSSRQTYDEVRIFSATLVVGPNDLLLHCV
jgi:glutathione S-transferase